MPFRTTYTYGDHGHGIGGSSAADSVKDSKKL